MEKKLLDLKDLLEVDEQTNILSCLGQRIIVADSISRGLLRRELIQIFGSYGAKNVLVRYGYAHGWRTAEMLKNKIPKLFYNTNGGAQLHMLFGLVYTTWMTEGSGVGDDPLIKSRLEHSYEAEQHLVHFGQSKEAVCWTLSGFASGYESFKRQREVYFIETKCVGVGDDYCELEGRYPDQWGDCLQDELPFYGMASTNDILSEISGQLLSTEQKLESTQKHLNTLESRVKAFKGMVIRSKPMQEIINLADRIARIPSPVVITGDSGVGKEVVARYIHSRSFNDEQPFIGINCGAFSEDLLESELFGHVKGAFTGAHRDHKGLFEEASGGTLFLDEIAETSPKMQVKLLRVLQEKEIKRVGESRSRKVDARIISATNHNLEEEVEKGNFRKDLFFRLKVMDLKIPALRDRTPDILPLAHQFLQNAREEMGVDVTGVTSEAADLLLRYDWPGNIRELQNVIYRAVALCDESKIVPANLPLELRTSQDNQTLPGRTATLEEMEKMHIENALKRNEDNKKVAAGQLGISLATLYRKIKAYNIVF